MWLITKLTIKEGRKEKAFYGSLILLLLSLVVYFIVLSFTMFESERVMLVYSLSAIQFVTLILVFFLSLTFLNEDLGQKSLEYILSLPIKRRDYLLGRFIGITSVASVVSLSGLLIYLILNKIVLGVFFYKSLLFFPFLVEFAGILVGLFFVLINASRRPILIFFIVVFIYVIGINLDDTVRFLLEGKADKIPVVSKLLVKLAYYVFPNFSFFDIKIPLAYDINISITHYILIVIYGILYIMFLMFLSIFFFEKKEIL